MEIQALTPASLLAFIQSDTYARMPVVPISPQRAWSHIHNPRVDPTDQVLFLAWDNGQLAGYLGVLADAIYVDGTRHKAGWLSCMWVDPAIRGKGIAKQLLHAVLASWENRILVTEFTVAAKGLYDRSEAFQDLVQPTGLRCYLRLNLHELLPRRVPRLRPLTGVLRALDAAANAAGDLRFRLFRQPDTLRFTVTRYVDHTLDAFIQARQDGQLTRRTAADLNWMLQYPWLVAAPGPDAVSTRYHFSSVATRTESCILRLTAPDGTLAGMMMLSIRERHLKVPYWYVLPEWQEAAVRLLTGYMIQAGVDMVSAFHPALCEGLRAPGLPFWHRRALHRHYIISKVFGAPPAAVWLQDGDADCGFT